MRSEPVEVGERAAADARALAVGGWRDDEFSAFLEAAGCAYGVAADGYSTRTWLAVVADGWTPTGPGAVL